MIAVGQVWRHRHRPGVTVEVLRVYELRDGTLEIIPRRNTSRRTQAIGEATLLRHYEPVQP